MKNRFSDIQNTKANLDSEADWREKPFSEPYNLIRLGTSFSGIGAIEHAMRRLNLNYEIQFAGDIDPDCKRSYFANYDIDESRWHTDIHQFDAKPYKGKIDIFVGGAPCQAFSIRGKRGGFEDTRGTLFSEFARIVIECQPQIFIFENVKGIMNHDKGRTWRTILKTFEDDCDYQVYYQVLNGKDYGIPQSRERLFCIGFKRPTDFKYPAAIHLSKSKYDFLDKEVDSTYFLKEKGVNFVTRTINHVKSYTQVNGNIMLCQKRNQQFNWHGDFVFHPAAKGEAEHCGNKDNIFRVSDFEESYFIGPDISSYALERISDTRYRMVNNADIDTRYGRYRKMTPRECLKLMGFDDSFKIAVPDTAIYKQAGNSIIVDVLMAVLKQLDITKYGINQ